VADNSNETFEGAPGDEQAPAQTSEMPAAGVGTTASPGVYCTRCGYLNEPSRGACLMCLNLLHDQAGGATCPSCGASNPSKASFCQNCGTAIAAGVAPVMTEPELAGAVLDALGDLGIGAGVGDAEGEYAGDEIGDYGDEEGFDALDEYAEAPAEGVKPPTAEVPEEAIPGPILEEAAELPSAEIEADADFLMQAPGAVEAEEEEFAPPPPPGIVEPEEEDFAPPPPPGIVEPEEDFAPPPPPGIVEPEEEDFAPPPPPPGLVEPEEEDFAPPPPPPGAELPPLEPAGDTDAAAKGEENGDFGNWELEFDDGPEEEEES